MTANRHDSSAKAVGAVDNGPVGAALAAAQVAGRIVAQISGPAARAAEEGAPGLRPHYHPNYYGAFVLDPDGHNIEAVCHTPA